MQRLQRRSVVQEMARGDLCPVKHYAGHSRGVCLGVGIRLLLTSVDCVLCDGTVYVKGFVSGCNVIGSGG